jgi:hypothetical protein
MVSRDSWFSPDIKSARLMADFSRWWRETGNPTTGKKARLKLNRPAARLSYGQQLLKKWRSVQMRRIEIKDHQDNCKGMSGGGS